MGTPVVLITGALTGIGRAAARAFAREGHRTVVAGRQRKPAETGELSCARSALKLCSSVRTCATRTRSGTWSIGPLRASVAWTSRSTTPAPKASPVR